MKNIQDLTLQDILDRKAEARHDLASLSFAAKVKIVEEMRERLAPFNAMRERKKRVASSFSTRDGS